MKMLDGEDESQPDPTSSNTETSPNDRQKHSMQKNKKALAVKLLVRRPISSLVDQGILPPHKITSPIMHDRQQRLERARMEDALKSKIAHRPKRSELIRRHIILEDSTLHVDPSLCNAQLQLKKAKLADSLSNQLEQRPGPLELIRKNILHLPREEEGLENAVKEGFIKFTPTKDGVPLKQVDLPVKYSTNCASPPSSSSSTSSTTNLSSKASSPSLSISNGVTVANFVKSSCGEGSDVTNGHVLTDMTLISSIGSSLTDVSSVSSKSSNVSPVENEISSLPSSKNRNTANAKKPVTAVLGKGGGGGVRFALAPTSSTPPPQTTTTLISIPTALNTSSCTPVNGRPMKFHEYKGPNVGDSKRLSTSSTIRESPESTTESTCKKVVSRGSSSKLVVCTGDDEEQSKYELLLKQQQMVLQWQLNEQNRVELNKQNGSCGAKIQIPPTPQNLLHTSPPQHPTHDPSKLPKNYEDWKVSDLRAELKVRGYSSVGIKQVLIDRLRNPPPSPPPGPPGPPPSLPLFKLAPATQPKHQRRQSQKLELQNLTNNSTVSTNMSNTTGSSIKFSVGGSLDSQKPQVITVRRSSLSSETGSNGSQMQLHSLKLVGNNKTPSMDPCYNPTTSASSSVDGRAIPQPSASVIDGGVNPNVIQVVLSRPPGQSHLSTLAPSGHTVQQQQQQQVIPEVLRSVASLPSIHTQQLQYAQHPTTLENWQQHYGRVVENPILISTGKTPFGGSSSSVVVSSGVQSQSFNTFHHHLSTDSLVPVSINSDVHLTSLGQPIPTPYIQPSSPGTPALRSRNKEHVMTEIIESQRQKISQLELALQQSKAEHEKLLSRVQEAVASSSGGVGAITNSQQTQNDLTVSEPRTVTNFSLYTIPSGVATTTTSNTSQFDQNVSSPSKCEVEEAIHNVAIDDMKVEDVQDVLESMLREQDIGRQANDILPTPTIFQMFNASGNHDLSKQPIPPAPPLPPHDFRFVFNDAATFNSTSPKLMEVDQNDTSENHVDVAVTDYAATDDIVKSETLLEGDEMDGDEKDLADWLDSILMKKPNDLNIAPS